MATKLHVEIGITDDESIAKIGGSGEDLIIAAAYVLNAFYMAFEENGGGDAFKLIMRELVRQDNSPVWEKDVGPR